MNDSYITKNINDNGLMHCGVLGMKWGVRRYQNKDGTLTDAGKKRYDRDVRENLSKKKENRIDTSKPDPNRWVKEDLERSKRAVDAGGELVRISKNIERETSPKSKRARMDLSKMTDQELRKVIDREQLELRYNDLFGQVEQTSISKGRKYTREILDVAGDVLSVGGSALAIALSIKALRG